MYAFLTQECLMKFFRIWIKDSCVQLTHPKACTRSCWTAGSATLRTNQPLRHFSGDWRISLCSMQGSISMHQMSCKKFYLFVYPFPTCFLFQIAYYLVRLHAHTHTHTHTHTHQLMVDHFTSNCTTQNTVPSHIEKPPPIYTLLNKITTLLYI